MAGIVKEERIGECRLILGDCAEVLPEIGAGDAVVTDPPYGIGEHGGKCRTRGKRGQPDRARAVEAWDKERVDPSFIARLAAAPGGAIIWGGNYYADALPAVPSWLYWRKLIGGDFADGELAWTSTGRALREFTKSTVSTRSVRVHPTQKPLALMEWCIDFLPGADRILDPFAGSGTTLVACAKRGRKSIGIERDPVYFEAACRRVEEAYRAPADMFGADAPAPSQAGFAL